MFKKSIDINTIVIFCLFIVGVSLSYGDVLKKFEAKNTPSSIVQKFCELDAKGVRLNSDSRGEIDPLLDWGEEGGYDTMSVINDFKVKQTSITDSEATVTVEYDLLGSTDYFVFAKDIRKYVVNYKLKKQNGVWKIKDPISAPQVNWKVAIAHLKRISKSDPFSKSETVKLNIIINGIRKAASK